MVVLHYTAMDSAAAALERLCDPAHEVSCHYLIGADGTLWQLVEEELRAWHAGQGSWGAVTDVNSRSIGIELDNRGRGSFAVAQLAVLERLLAEILARWNIPPERVIGHQDMAPARKQDPGRWFPWPRLAGKGLAIWPEGRPARGRFLDSARAFGYPEADAGLLLEAFRARFRPMAAGRLSEEDRRMMAELAARFPVDGGGARG
ncbi:N-acetylmuramoyl-L-alanine amidase [Mangrovicoccus algicola]|uniref:N-acetylmuramoyl-L-alanine amidase n=1 Tax=Mangrovicoccus algicola TaxID=2771008 RepID=A0A8J6Z236_9RHOB|nr:N-acetylmuramoyl-L-alanine amidase [Mangrovicoccus algicola]MBE3640283.1 N-acetylmuramoyl-L-alanine amidase [Mangrovicoccus algicola]